MMTWVARTDDRRQAFEKAAPPGPYRGEVTTALDPLLHRVCTTLSAEFWVNLDPEGWILRKTDFLL